MLTFIPTPIGNLEDISKRSLKLLSSATHIFCEDTRITKRLLNLLKERYSLDIIEKQFFSLHSHNEDKVIKNLDISIFDNECVYVSDAGMPAISDPGAKLVKFCQENDIKYEVLPGANALLLAYATSGFYDTSFSFFGFLPHKGKERENELKKVLSHSLNAILYESPHRIEKLFDELLKYSPEREIFAIKEATKKFEKRLFGTVKDVHVKLKEYNLKGEWVVIIKAKPSSTPSAIHIEDIISLDLPPKQKAKLLAKVSNKSVKEWYNEISQAN